MYICNMYDKNYVVFCIPAKVMWSRIPGDVAKYLYLAAILASAYLCLCPKSFAPQEAFCKSFTYEENIRKLGSGKWIWQMKL